MRLNGNMLRDARDRKALTQTAVAVKLGMSTATVNSAENGADIHASTGRRICEFLGIDLAKAVIPRVANEGDGNAA